jgi:capsular polysaccharide biosynthesis protein
MSQKSYTLKEITSIFFKNILLIIVLAGVGGAIFFAVAKHKSSITYTASREIMISQNLNSKRAYSQQKTELNMIPTYRDMIESRQVMLAAKNNLPRSLKKKTNLIDLSKAISTDSHPDSLIISVKATAGDKKEAITYVNSVSEVAKEQLPKMQPGMGRVYLYPAANSKNVDKTVHTSIKKYTLVGIALGIIAGMVISFTITSIKELN